MEKLLTFDMLPLVIVLILPGLISMWVYRILMAAKPIDSGTVFLEALSYGLINLGLGFPVLSLAYFYEIPAKHPFVFLSILWIILLVAPIIWPLLLVKCFKCRFLMKGLQLPYPTPWDYFFDKRQVGFVLVHLNNGKKIGGYYGADSYAGSYPNDGDIYIERVCVTDAEGKFHGYLEGTHGMLIRKDQYEYIELFEVPSASSDTDNPISKETEDE